MLAACKSGGQEARPRQTPRGLWRVPWLSGRALRGAFGCRWDLCLRCCISGWRGRRGVPLHSGLSLIVPGLLIRALASGHVRKNEALATSGPYAYTRNPLYLGSLLIGIGFAVAARSWWVGVALVVMFFAIYLPVIRDEEDFLRQKFPEFEEYARRVPRMFPRIMPHADSAKRRWRIFVGSLSEASRVQRAARGGGDDWSACREDENAPAVTSAMSAEADFSL